MRVLLIRPNSIIPGIPVPIGLGYIAGKLIKERGDQVEILDARNLRWPLSRVRQRLREFNPEVVGITAINFEMREAHELAAAARAELPGAKIILGGPYASANREAILADENLDAVVVGEGEDTTVELLAAFENGADLAGVKGIICRVDGEPRYTGERELIHDLDTLEPAWDLLHPTDYFKRWKKNSENIVKYDHRTLSVFTSRGCPYSCIFCHNIFGKTFRPRSPEAVVAEIAMLRQRYGIRELEIIDDSFNMSKRRAMEICAGVAPLKLHISLPNGIRSDRTSPELFDALKAAGFYRIAFAVEAASPRIQKLIRKDLDLDKARAAIAECARRGIMATGFFIQGFPGETYEEMLSTGDWAAQSDLHVASFFYLNPFPGTEVARMIGKQFTATDFRDYSTMSVNVSAATDAEMHAANKYAYRRFYLSPRRIFRTAAVTPKNLRTFVNAWLVVRLLFQDSVNQ